ncbi:ethanolamine utilization protein EutJ [Bacillus sp. HMF5848]|uniref:ABC transporter substrate-binding protein n=1 Tax=Bacillus sp. HMF5848 TaxID=2495421 RepID=UPI000F772021|nr:ABC transporter substrate-binding protein [Bacillus sp. HMF5848]RSK27353.1 ethanolamine utilization protein EutJ [Bacillus sp. HMF5848]
MKKLFISLTLLFILVIFTGCGNADTTTTSPSDNSNDQASTTDVSSESSEEKTVYIGFSGPLSGPAAFYGENTLSGVEMAADEINAAGGFKVNGDTYKIEIVSLDDKYLPNETGTNARRLVQENDASIIFVPHSGGVFATQVFNEQDGFLIAAYTSEPKIQDQGNKLTLSIPPAYNAYPEPYSDYMMERFGKKLALLPTATQYGKDWTETLVPVWESMGGEVVFDGSIDFSKDTDFFTIVTNALNEKPDVLFVGGPSQPTALVIKQARELGFKGGFMVMDQAKFEEMEPVLGGYELLEGAIGALPLVESEAPGGQTFAKKYEEIFGRIPTAEGGFNYQALHVLVNAMEAAGTVSDPNLIMEHVNDGIQALADEEMVWYLSGLEEGRFDWDTAIFVVENGKLVQVME